MQTRLDAILVCSWLPLCVFPLERSLCLSSCFPFIGIPFRTFAMSAVPPHTCLQLVEICSPFARIAVTGSGLVSLLNSFRTARVNSFALWDAVRHVGLGSAPSHGSLVADDIALAGSCVEHCAHHF